MNLKYLLKYFQLVVHLRIKLYKVFRKFFQFHKYFLLILSIKEIDLLDFLEYFYNNKFLLINHFTTVFKLFKSTELKSLGDILS